MANHVSSRCAKHSHLHQTPGVCPSCLRDRLYDLIVSSEDYGSRFSDNPYSVSSTSLYTALQSTSPPAARRKHGHRRNGSAVDAASSVLLTVVSMGSGGGGLKKSRSMAFVARNGNITGGENLKKKKRGFWSSLIHFKAN